MTIPKSSDDECNEFMKAYEPMPISEARSVAYVENYDFRVAREMRVGCMGRRLLLREYRLKDDPAAEPSCPMISHTIVAKWALSGCPSDAIYHLGPFFRVTVL